MDTIYYRPTNNNLCIRIILRNRGGAAAGSARPVGVNFCVMAPNFEMARNLAYFADVINGNTLHTACILSYDVFN